MKTILSIFFSLMLLLSGCIDQKNIEYGMNLRQIERNVTPEESNYFINMEYIFEIYDFVLFEKFFVRNLRTYYFEERVGNFNMENYINIVKPKLYERGWRLVEKNNYGEYYCDENNNELGVTFPTNDIKLDGVNLGYFTYQSYNKLNVALSYDISGGKKECQYNGKNKIMPNLM